MCLLSKSPQNVFQTTFVCNDCMSISRAYLVPSHSVKCQTTKWQSTNKVKACSAAVFVTLIYLCKQSCIGEALLILFRQIVIWRVDVWPIVVAPFTSNWIFVNCPRIDRIYSESRSTCFWGCSIKLLINSLVIHPSLVFEGKVRAYPSGDSIPSWKWLADSDKRTSLLFSNINGCLIKGFIVEGFDVKSGTN